MTSKIKSRGWYDGWLYAWLIDSDFTSFRNRIFKYIETDKMIIDVGCGTGGFTLKLAKISKYVLGVDISEKQIAVARNRLSRSDLTNVQFLTVSATDLKDKIDSIFDYAILTFIIHEVYQDERIRILTHLQQVARRIVILDFYYPLAGNFPGYILRLTEFFAGRVHFKNFLDYNRRGGLIPLLEEAGLEIVQDKINKPRVFRTVVTKHSQSD